MPKDLNLTTDEDGKIKPSKAALHSVERQYPNASDAERYRLAQATELIRAVRSSG